MDLLFVLIALGTGNQDRAVKENLFSRWDVLFSVLQVLSFPGMGFPCRAVGLSVPLSLAVTSRSIGYL